MAFSTKKAARTKKFIENLKHTKAEWAGVNFLLADWQWKKIIRPLYGTLRADKQRQYRTCLCMLPRKQGKSELAAAIALYHLFADNEPGGEIYSAAVDRDQSALVFNVAAQMVRQAPALKARCKIIDSQKRIVVHKTASFYRAISSEVASAHGYNASAIIYDELHAAASRDLFDVLSTSTGARRQPLLFIISTSGFDRHSILWEQYDYAKKILDKNSDTKDPTFLPVIYEAPEDADWHDEKVWKKCNPALGDFRKIEEMRAFYNKAKETPALENTFRRLYLNQWTESETRWINMDKWDACDLSKIDPEKLKGRPCYSGLDLSSNIDVTALVHVFPPDDPEGVYQVLPEFFIPKDNMQKRSRKDRVPYDMWVRAGLITATPGNVVDYKFIIDAVIKAGMKYDLQEVPYDRWGATKVAQDLDEEGILLVPFGQGFASMAGPTKELETLILQRRINHGGNPVLRWMAGNMVVKTDPAGNTKPDKAKSTEKIDGIVATIMALGRAVMSDGPFKSVYEGRGITIL